MCLCMGEFLERINFKYYPHYPLDALNLYVAMLMDYAPLSLSLSLVINVIGEAP